MLHQLHMFYTNEEIFSCSGGMVILGGHFSVDQSAVCHIIFCVIRL